MPKNGICVPVKMRRALSVCASGCMVLAASLALRSAVPAQAQDDAAALQAPMAVLWKYTGPASSGSAAGPVMGGDMVFFATGKKVYALDSATGARKWVYPDGAVMSQPALATPAYSDGTLFVPTGDGLYAFDASTGKLKYPAFKLINGGVTTTPIVWQGSVYFGAANGKLYGLDVQTGQPLPNAFGKGLDTQVGLMGNMTEDGGDLYFATSNNMLHAVTIASATQRWEESVVAGADSITPVIKKGLIYLADGQTLLCFRETGQLYWTLKTRYPITNTPAVDNKGNIYFTNSYPAVFAINANRELMWKKPVLLDYISGAGPVISGNLLVLGTTAAGVYAIDRKTGELVWDFSVAPTSVDPSHVPTVNRILTRPVADGSTLLVATDDGSLTAFNHTAVDTIAPSITPVLPMVGEYCNGTPPFIIQANITDQGSGLNPATISMELDGKNIPMSSSALDTIKRPGFVFRKDTGVLKYTIEETSSGVSNTLLDGHHTVTITARDWMGNLATRTWIFTVGEAYPNEGSLKKQNRNGFGGMPGGGGFGRPGVGGRGKGGGGG